MSKCVDDSDSPLPASPSVCDKENTSSDDAMSSPRILPFTPPQRWRPLPNLDESIDVSDLLDYLNHIHLDTPPQMTSPRSAKVHSRIAKSLSVLQKQSQSLSATVYTPSSSMSRADKYTPLADQSNQSSNTRRTMLGAAKIAFNPKLAALMQHQSPVNRTIQGENIFPVLVEDSSTTTSPQDNHSLSFSTTRSAISSSAANARFEEPQSTPHTTMSNTQTKSDDEQSYVSVQQEPPQQSRKVPDAPRRGVLSDDEWNRLQALQNQVQQLWQEAYEERATARKFATDLRSSVQKWVQEQRALVACERQLSQDQLDTLAKERQRSVTLQDALDILQIDMEAAKLSQQTQETKLEETIRQQAFQIQQLQDRIGTLSFGATRTEEHSTRSSGDSQKRPRVSLSPFSALRQPHRTMETPRSSRTKCTRPDGSSVKQYRSGAEKEVRHDGFAITRFPNGDCEERSPDGIRTYYYAADKTTRICHPDGVVVYKYSNDQVEHHYPDGNKDIRFSDGTQKRILADGSMETVFPDGVHVIIKSDGTRQVTRFD